MPQLSPVRRRSIAFAGSYLLLLIGMIALTHSPLFSARPDLLGRAILFDLTVWPTLLFYGFIARPAKLSVLRLTVAVAVFVRIALLVLPENARPFTIDWPVLFAGVEGIMLVFVVVRIRVIVLTYRKLRAFQDAETALSGSLQTVLGSTTTTIMLSEWQTIRWGLLGWWRVEPLSPNHQPLTTHHNSGQVAMGVALLVVGLIEVVAVHLLIARWNPTAAFWVSAFSGYGMLFLVADLVASCQRPSLLTPTDLHIRVGIRWQAAIPKSLILSVVPIHEKPAKAPDLLNGVLIIAPNTLITLREPVTINGPYGIRRPVSRITLFLDDGAGKTSVLTQHETSVSPT